MNRIFCLFMFSFFFFSCSKEKKSLRQIDGSWEMKSYKEISPSGLSKLYDLDSGEASFKRDKGQNSGTVILNWRAFSETDTSVLQLDGKFVQISPNDLNFEFDSDTLNFHFVRQLKKDMECEMKLNSGKNCVLIFRKKS